MGLVFSKQRGVSVFKMNRVNIIIYVNNIRARSVYVRARKAGKWIRAPPKRGMRRVAPKRLCLIRSAGMSFALGASATSHPSGEGWKKAIARATNI